MAQRCGDAAPYPVALTRDGGSLVWTVSDSDTAKNGVGRCELTYLVGGAVAKSKTWQTQVLASFTADGSTEPPEPAQSWVQEVLDAATAAGKSAEEAADSADKAESATVHAPQIGADGAWETWDQATGAYVSTGVEAQGPKGEDAPIVQPDWTQNDETAADYVKNRSGGYDIPGSELATTGSFAPDGTDFGYAAVDFPVKFIVDGQKVTVKIENETFERTVQKIPDDQKINKNNLAEYWIRRTEGEDIGDNEWVFIFQLQSEGTWSKGTIATGTYHGKAFEVYAEVATPVKFPAKYVDTRFIVTCTIAQDSDDNLTVSNPSHTFDEISAAYRSGIDVVLQAVLEETFTSVLDLQATDGSTAFQWGGVVVELGLVYILVQKESNTDSWDMYISIPVEQDQLSEIRQLPASTSADKDKFLRVDASGNPVWETVANANGGSF